MLICMFASFHFFQLPLSLYEQNFEKREKKMNKSNTAYFVADFNTGKRRSKREREKDSNHSNEGLSLLGPDVVCPGSLFLAPC